MKNKIIEFIKSEYEARKKRNKNYSIRAFANSLAFDHSLLSKLLNYKKAITFDAAYKILSNLDIQDVVKNSLLLSLSESSNYMTKREDQAFIFLTEEELNLTYKWQAYAVLSALEINTIQPTREGLSKFLSIEMTMVEEIVSIFIKLKAIQEKSDKTLQLTGVCYSTSNNITNAALVKAHINHIEQAIEHLQELIPNGDITGTTIAIPIDKLDEAKRRIKEFRRSFSAWINQESFDKTDVYRLNIQFFPLGKKKSTLLDE